MVNENPDRCDWSDMEMDDLEPPAPPGSTLVAALAGGTAAAGWQPGDFVLSRAHGINHYIIKFGQRLRIRGADKCYVGYTHAALVVSAEGDLVEAVGAGVRTSSLESYAANKEIYRIVRIQGSAEDRKQVIDFAISKVNAKAPYGFLTNLSIAWWAFTGSRFTFFIDGSFTCSGLVAAALEKTSVTFATNAARVMPAQLAIYFKAPPPLPDPPRPTRAPLALFRRRRA